MHAGLDRLSKWGQYSYETLKQVGANIELKNYPGMLHTVTASELQYVATFIESHMPPM